MSEVYSTPNDSSRLQIDLIAAQLQWQEAAALASDASRSHNVNLHREALRVAKSAIVRIGVLVEAAAKANCE